MPGVAHLLARILDPSCALDERIAAGHALAEAGDPRLTSPSLVLIPGGPFLHRRRREAQGNEAVPREDAREITVSAFQIDKYPVTVAAFAAFIADGGYRKKGLWSKRGWAFRSENALECPRFWGEAEWRDYLVPNHPVVGVSAFEAEAFAEWRGGRLPREAEWEKACAGVSGCHRPWGDEWLEDACAMRSVGPRKTIPIGMFPRGESAFGVSDMVGCVWQWCADAADPEAEWDDEDPFVDPELYAEGSPRVTRGGAWNTLGWSVCCTAMNGYPESARFSNLGFRCVVDAD